MCLHYSLALTIGREQRQVKYAFAKCIFESNRRCRRPWSAKIPAAGKRRLTSVVQQPRPDRSGALNPSGARPPIRLGHRASGAIQRSDFLFSSGQLYENDPVLRCHRFEPSVHGGFPV